MQAQGWDVERMYGGGYYPQWKAEGWNAASMACPSVKERDPYKRANNCGEQFKNCADVSVGATGEGISGTPPAPAPSPPVVQPTGGAAPAPPAPTTPPATSPPATGQPAQPTGGGGGGGNGQCQDKSMTGTWAPHACAGLTLPAYCAHEPVQMACCGCPARAGFPAGGDRSSGTTASTSEPEPTSEPATPASTPAATPEPTSEPETPATPASTPSSGPLECKDCKSKCQTKCSGHLATNQCWGGDSATKRGRWIECKCSDGTRHTFFGCECEHSTCPGGWPAPESLLDLTEGNVGEVKSHRFLAAAGSSFMSESADRAETDEILVESHPHQEEL